MSDKQSTTGLPAPLVPADVDLTGFSSFMLDVDRLFTSEIVAIGTPEECWAAHLLMCRAWKQTPPGSLPDDPRILAAFSGVGKRWVAVEAMALREFVKCSDGRWYHPALADEAVKAWKRRQQYKADQERLRKWRENKKDVPRNGGRNKHETADETRFKTVSETVCEPERQDRTGHYNSDLKIGTPAEIDDPFGPDPAEVSDPAVPPTARGGHDPSAAERELFARGKAVLGESAGGQITKLIRAKGGNIALARAAIETASTKHNAREYVAATIRGDPSGLPNGQLYDRSI